MTKLTLKQRKRAAIIAAARKEILANGYRESNMDVIAANAEVSKRTLYNHFPGKAELFSAIVMECLAEFRAVTAIEYNTDLELATQLQQYADALVDLLVEPDYSKIFRLLIEESPAREQVITSLVNALESDEDPLESWILAAATDSKLQCPDAKVAAGELQSMLKGPFFWHTIALDTPPPAGEVRDAVIESAITTFLARYEGKA